jgi:hypothetical protein
MKSRNLQNDSGKNGINIANEFHAGFPKSGNKIWFFYCSEIDLANRLKSGK